MAMTMVDYLREIEYAATKTLELVWQEHMLMAEVQGNVGVLTAEIEEAARVEFLAINPDLDNEGLGTMVSWDSYFGPEKQQHHTETDIRKLAGLIGVRRIRTFGYCRSGGTGSHFRSRTGPCSHISALLRCPIRSRE